MTIPLIDKQDTFEIVGVQIAAILAAETVAQQALATAAAKDPDLWTFEVFHERFHPFEHFQSNPDAFPVVNVWYDTSSFNPANGDVVKQQRDEATYNIDCYAMSPASNNVAGGFNPGDESSSLALHRIARLVRNIIMHPDNTYLQLGYQVGTRIQNLVGRRWLNSKEVFQPQIGERPIQGLIACRFNLSVSFNEYPVSEDFETLEVVGIIGRRSIDDKIILESDIDTT